MQVTPSTAERLGSPLDHPEGLAIGPDGTIWCGGEAGQIYRIDPDGKTSQPGMTGGSILGVALDAAGRLHLCDWARDELLVFDPRNSSITPRARINTPNWGAFLPNGDFLVSSSGEFYRWQETPGQILRLSPDGEMTLFHGGPFAFANGIAVDPTREHLYIAESTIGRISRIALRKPSSLIEVVHDLPPGTVPDGLAFAADGRLLIACYAPDAIMVAERDGTVSELFTDRFGDLLNRPANVALHDGYLYSANLGGSHITRLRTELSPLPLARPSLP